MDALSTFHTNFNFYYNPKILHISYFFLLIPVMSCWIIDEWTGIFNRQIRIAVQQMRVMLISASIPNGAFNIYFCCTYGTDSYEGKVHMLASLYVTLFILMLVYNFRRDLDVRTGVVTSYLGLVVSFFTLVAEYLGKSGEAELLEFFFKGGIGVYFIGLILIAFLQMGIRIM